MKKEEEMRGKRREKVRGKRAIFAMRQRRFHNHSKSSSINNLNPAIKS